MPRNEVRTPLPETALGRRLFLRGVGTTAIIAGAGGAISLITGCSSSSSSNSSGGASAAPNSSGGALTSASYTTPFGFIPSFVEAYVAQQQGFWKKEGLTVTVHGGTGTSGSLQAVLAGSSQFGRGGGTDMIDIVNQNAPFIEVASVFAEAEFVVASPASKPITNPKQLKGQTIGTVSAGGETAILLQAMFASVGMSQSDYKTVVTGPGAAPYQEATRGQVAAWVDADNNVAGLAATPGASIKSFKIFDFAPIPGDSYVVSKSFAQSNKDEIVAFLKGLLAAMEFTADKSNWDAVAKSVQAYSPGTSTDTITQQLPIIIADWQANGADKMLELDTKTWSNAQNMFKQIGLIKKTLPITDIIDTSFVTAAKG